MRYYKRNNKKYYRQRLDYIYFLFEISTYAHIAASYGINESNIYRAIK